MSQIKNMSMVELASYVCENLHKNSIEVVLSGGSCVEIYSKGDYTSYDLDLVNRYNERFFKIKTIMEALGFTEKGKYFIHKDTEYFIEFPSGPLGVGDSSVEKLEEIRTKYGILKLLTPTDCVKDRLAAYFHWDDNQSLQQALWVAQQNKIDLDELKQWSLKENAIEKFEVFLQSLQKK
jgi:hypothetical protein